MIPGNPVELVGFPAVAAVSGIVFAVPFLLLLFKFWFAPEACVIGQYGPVESLRVSWHITTNYRGKFLLIVLIAVGSAIGLYLPAVLPEIGTGLASLAPVLGMISSSVGELLSMGKRVRAHLRPGNRFMSRESSREFSSLELHQ